MYQERVIVNIASPIADKKLPLKYLLKFLFLTINSTLPFFQLSTINTLQKTIYHIKEQKIVEKLPLTNFVANL